MFDLTLQILGVVVNQLEEVVEVQLIIGLPLPAGQGTVNIPSGVVRFHLGRDGSIAKGKEILEAGEALPKESDIEAVTDPDVISKITKAAKNE